MTAEVSTTLELNAATVENEQPVRAKGSVTCETTFTLHVGLSFKVTTLFSSVGKAKTTRDSPRGTFINSEHHS